VTLPARQLGINGPKISVLGLGAWAIGGSGWSFGWGPQDDADSISTMHHAVEAGITWIDTAAVYGHGHSEEVVGRFLRDLADPERPLVFTKGGLRWDDADPMKEPLRDLGPRVIRSQCEDSLRRLAVDRIDLYQFHWPDETGVPVEESWGEMQRLIDEGKIRWGGVSNFDVGLLRRCEQQRHVDSLQPRFSAVARRTAEELLPWAHRHGTGVICHSPMANGRLTDAFSLQSWRDLPSDDWRRTWDEDEVRRHLSVRDALAPVARRHGVSVAAIAVAWVLAWPGVTAAIVGARRPEQVDGWIAAAGVQLSRHDMAEIAQAIRHAGAGSGPEQPA
jgi:aryl-alcohol dehydrogenase-like predicted oxidoreductase